MKTVAACLPCFVDDLLGALELMDLPRAKVLEVVEAAFAYLGKELGGEEGWNRTPSRHITALHRIIKSRTGIALPFADLREACNRLGMEVAQRREAALEGLDGPQRFRDLVLWAIAGNHLDFRTVGTGYGFSADRIIEWLSTIASEPLAVDRVEEIHALLSTGGKVLYIPDNVGEIALDALLVREIRSFGNRVAVPYRGGAITSDATLEDFRAVGLDRAADEVFPAGPDTLGISFEEMSPELKAALALADVVLTKGQANYYAVSEHLEEIPGAVICLLRTKCEEASRPLGALAHTNVATILKFRVSVSP